MTDVLVGDLMVVRFSPYSAEKLSQQAEREAAELSREGKPVIYSISTFGMVRLSDAMTVNEMITTICQTAPVQGKNVAVTTERRLEEEGFRVERSEPPLHHHDVIFGNELREMDVKRLEALLASGVRRNPAWVKRK
ncbi:hypothetical protein [Streptomyces sp. NPDC005732]|uniref:hypothetical protein n=1 Tax=Streptomyces sp. NPDC005732 TaxID=3157057 RepID=UPI0033F64498